MTDFSRGLYTGYTDCAVICRKCASVLPWYRFYARHVLLRVAEAMEKAVKHGI